jgi:hypothetical protein
MGADPSANPWERVLLLDQLPRVLILSLPDQSQIADDVRPGGAVVIAGRGFIHVQRPDIPPAPSLVNQGRSEGHREVRHIGFSFEHNFFCHRSSFLLGIGYWVLDIPKYPISNI